MIWKYFFFSDNVCHSCITEIYLNMFADIMEENQVDGTIVKSKYAQHIKVNWKFTVIVN